MKHRAHILRCFRASLSATCRFLAIAMLLTGLLAGRGMAQAAPAATWPSGDTNPGDQPLPGQQLGSDLSLNQGVSTINAENESIDRYGLGVLSEGGEETNFFGTQTNQVNATYATFAGSGAVQLHNERTRYYALYRIQYNLFPQYSNVDNFGNYFYQDMTHEVSERLAIAWGLTAARYLSVNQFLPQNLNIGGIAIVVPLQTQLLQNSFEVTNFGTTARIRYLMSTRTTLTATAAGAYFLSFPADIARPGLIPGERFITAGADLRLAYQWKPKDVIGAAITPLIIYGVTPTGHATAETIQATYQRQVTPTLIVGAAAGPLFIQSSSPTYGSQNQLTYALNGNIAKQMRQDQFSLAYSRAFFVGFLGPGITANSVTFQTYIPFWTHWLVTSNALYTKEALNGFGGGTIFAGTGQLGYLIGHNIQLYGKYYRLSENLTFGQQIYNFTQNKFGAGIQFNLGNPIARGGAQ